MDSLLTALVLLIVSALATWFKQRAGKGTDNSSSDSPQNAPPANRPRPPQAMPRPTSWEDELRRLLEGQSSAPPAPRTPPPMRTPPPVARPQAPPVAAPPPVVIRPVLVSPSRPMVAPASRPVVVPTPVPSQLEASASQLAGLKESRAAYERASQLDKQVARHIERVPGQRVGLTSVTRRAVSQEISQVVSLFNSARMARQAVIASIILGPPRSIEEMMPVN